MFQLSVRQVPLQGSRELALLIDRQRRRFEKEKKTRMRKAVLIARREARKTVLETTKRSKKGTGALAKIRFRVRSKRGDVFGRVFPDYAAYYARYVEHGTRRRGKRGGGTVTPGIRGRKFLALALSRRHAEIQELLGGAADVFLGR